MAKLHITEYTRLTHAAPGGVANIALQPGANQVVNYTTSTQSVAFAASTKFVRLIADAKAHISFGASPTADADDAYIAADVPEYFGVKAGDEVAAYDGSS